MVNNVKNKELLENEIKREIEYLKTLSPGTAEHADTVETITKLYKLNLELVENDRAFLFKMAQTKDDKQNQYCKFGIEAAGIVLPLMFYGVWMKKGLKFEETGVFTSTTFRSLFNKFKPH